jgi:hypothetical protein
MGIRQTKHRGPKVYHFHPEPLCVRAVLLAERRNQRGCHAYQRHVTILSFFAAGKWA